MDRRPIVLAGAQALMVTLATPPATADEVVLKPRIGIEASAQYLQIRHGWADSKGIIFAPASLLAYDPFAEVSGTVGLRATVSGGAWLDAELKGLAFGQGTLDDSDYDSAGPRISQTFSAVHRVNELGLTLKGWIGLGSDSEGFTLSPYAVATVDLESRDARGLECGSPCQAHTLDSRVTVLRHDLSSLAIGAGTDIGFATSAASRAIGGIRLLAGALRLADSHNLRDDLGATPNIVSDFLTIETQAEAGYEARGAPNMRLTTTVYVQASYGIGTTTFASQTDHRETVAADMLSLKAGLSLSLSGQF